MEINSKIYRGYLTRFLLKKDTGWGLALFADEQNQKLQIKIKGQIGSMQPKVLYEIQGVNEKHQKFGTSVNVENYKLAEINSPDATIKYLASPFFPGIGQKAATLIVNHYQTEVLKKIKNDPETLFLVAGLSRKQATIVLEKLTKVQEDDLTELFYENNLSLEIYHQVQKLKSPNDTIRAVLENEFLAFARTFNLYPFEQADKIALHFGLEPTSNERIAFWAEKIALRIAFASGDTYTTLNNLKTQLKKTLQISDQKLIQAGLLYAKEHQLLYFVNQKIYSAEAWEDEQTIVTGLKDLKTKKENSRLPNQFSQALKIVEKQVSQILKVSNFAYDQDQVEALKTFLKSPVTLITGGPGTGKTTLITGLILLYQHYFSQNRIGIAAPTGRAAARLKESLINQRCVTIHKMLEADDKGNFAMNEKFPLNFDLLILDETSMVENHLFAQLIKAKGPKLKKIVLVGDCNQLPPIGYGQIFDDLIQSQSFAFCQLQKIHRQAKGNGVIDLALAIQNNQVNKINWEKLNHVEAYFDQNLQNSYQMLKLDYALNQKAIAKSPFNYQVITPFYAGELGIESLNSFIQTTFNDQIKTKKMIYDRGRYRYAVGDKIMNLKNNADLDLTNGEMGIIKELKLLDAKTVQAIAEFSGEKNIVLDNALFNDVALGYACSVHKTQGSEYQNVVFVLESSTNNFFLNKRLIYTAVTRAKANLLIIGDYELFCQASAREAKPRKTTIQEKLLG